MYVDEETRITRQGAVDRCRAFNLSLLERDLPFTKADDRVYRALSELQEALREIPAADGPACMPGPRGPFDDPSILF